MAYSWGLRWYLWWYVVRWCLKNKQTWWYVVTCGDMWWYVVICGDMWWFLLWFSWDLTQQILWKGWFNGIISRMDYFDAFDVKKWYLLGGSQLSHFNGVLMGYITTAYIIVQYYDMIPLWIRCATRGAPFFSVKMILGGGYTLYKMRKPSKTGGAQCL